jgi:hypothetical protein
MALEDGMELLSRNENVMPRSGTKFSSPNRETSFLPCICALRAAQADSAYPLPFPACQETAVGEQTCISAPHARITLTIYRSRTPMSSRSRVSSAVRHRSRIELGVCGATDPDTIGLPKPASRTLDNTNPAQGKNEKKGQKIYNPSSQPIQNTATLEEQNHF